MSLLQSSETTDGTQIPDGRFSGSLLVLVLLALGFLLRLFHAEYRFLNGDEALHYLLSVQPSLMAAYHASLSTTHPPLLILFLHWWGMIARSELFLRLPSVLAGTGFCWLMYRWLRTVTEDATALFAFVLLLFSPALVLLSAEVRQYGLLLLFSSASLCFLEIGFQQQSISRMLWSALFLYLALLTHYSSLIFALAIGLYAILRIAITKTRGNVLAVWVCGQLGALAIVSSLFIHHVSKLEARGTPEALADSYLRGSVFQPAEDHVLSFVARANIRLFDYFFSQAAVGVLALLLFVIGVVLLVRQRPLAQEGLRPPGWLLAGLLLFPLVANCALAVLRIYPYGGTRHDSYLSFFAFPAIAVALGRWRPQWKWQKLTGVGVVLTICNLFPSPPGQYIHLRDQRRGLMLNAVATLRTLPTGSIIFTDGQGGLVLSYYLCHAKAVQTTMPYRPYWSAPCGNLTVLSIDPRKWSFKAETFSATLRGAQKMYSLRPGTPLWVFQLGRLAERKSSLRDELQRYDCASPQKFGNNVFLCRITVPATDGVEPERP
jgi:Dolichyl-phosphate-mannose-protein mannosyltransferase